MLSLLSEGVTPTRTAIMAQRKHLGCGGIITAEHGGTKAEPVASSKCLECGKTWPAIRVVGAWS